MADADDGEQRLKASRRHRLGITLFAIGFASGGVVGCATPRPSPVPSRTATPPPTPRVDPPVAADWPLITFEHADFPDPPKGFRSEHAVAVTASLKGFVAVGYAEGDGQPEGSLWFSADGATWEREGVGLGLEGVTMVDVAATTDAFVATGTEYGDVTRGKPTRTVILRSDDGVTWERLPDVTGAPEAYSGAVAASPAGFLMTTFTLDADGLVIAASADGRVWRMLPPGAYGDAASGISAPVWTGRDWIGAGVRFGSPVVLRSPDGGTWTATRLESPDLDGDIATEVLAGAWGALAVGIASTGCGTAAPCAGRRVAWWSSDGATWGRAPAPEDAIDQGLVIADGSRGVVSISGLDAWSSPDGLAWRSLGQPERDLTVINDAVVRGNVVVAVGDSDREDGTTYPTFIVGGPTLIQTN